MIGAPARWAESMRVGRQADFCVRTLMAAFVLVVFALASPARAQTEVEKSAHPDRRAGIAIPMDERAIRAAGIVVGPIEPEHGGADFALPGNVVIPPPQVHVVAAPAAGLVEALLVSADEQAK